jgi:hypothetical protein
MNRDTFKLIMAIGVLLNSALYLFGVLFLAIILCDPAAAKLAIAAIGVTYLSYVAQFVADEHAEAPARAAWHLAPLLVWTSIILGVVAGLVLLFS